MIYAYYYMLILTGMVAEGTSQKKPSNHMSDKLFSATDVFSTEGTGNGPKTSK